MQMQLMHLFLGLRKKQMSRKTVVLDFFNENCNVVYLMTKTFRIYNNYSLAEAYKYSQDNSLNLVIVIVEPYEENFRNLEFFNERTSDLEEKLKQLSDKIFKVSRDYQITQIFEDTKAIYIDKAYLRFDLEYYNNILKYANKHGISLFEVEANVFVPIREVSDKEEYSARTIRSKITKKMSEYQEEVLLGFKKTNAEIEALRILEDFITNKLDKYHLHNDPSLKLTSDLSPYLKYGFISPVTIYNLLKPINSENKESFIEELVVRRELAYNFVYFNPTYDNFKYMTYDWAYLTMDKHLKDKRDYLYNLDDYINFRTHDVYFNAAMKEMIYLGKMHSYMRMYWCKKIIEWSKTYEEAYQIAIRLNNYYFLDGLTPNGYCGVAWCFGKHDRAWTERPIFGKLRYMNANGLKRKFNIDKYVEDMNKID